MANVILEDQTICSPEIRVKVASYPLVMDLFHLGLAWTHFQYSMRFPFMEIECSQSVVLCNQGNEVSATKYSNAICCFNWPAVGI